MFDFAQARKNMVDCQIHPSGVLDDRILHAFENIPRENFVPASRQMTACQDENIELGQGRFILDPHTHARMIDVAGLRDDDVVLDIGCATGYSSAILSSMVMTVIAMEDDQHLLDQATENWMQADVLNAAGMLGVLSSGCPQCAPFSLIVLNGAVAEIPHALEDQIAPGGRLVCILQKSGEKIGKIVCLSKELSGHISMTIHQDASMPYVRGFEPRNVFVF